MTINENTKLIGRFHKVVSPRGLNIYNPTFQELGINAVYMLFVNESPAQLTNAMRELRMAGAISVGFETDPTLVSLVDEVDEAAKYIGKMGFIKNTGGKLRGYYQGGEGILQAVEASIDPKGKKLVVVGSGNVAKGLLLALSKRKYKVAGVDLYNRTLEKAVAVKKDFPFVTSAYSLDDIENATGDILVNATEIGSKPGEKFFSEGLVSRFGSVVDVTFEIKDTELIKSAAKLGKNIVTGWEFFTYQGLVVLETILDQKIDPAVLRKYVYAGLSQTVT